MENDDIVVYILSRTDLPSLNPGKAMAQIHHAGVQMMDKAHGRFAEPIKKYIDQGRQQGADGFNTTLVLGTTLCEIQTVCEEIKMSYLYEDSPPWGLVEDPSYPFVVDSEVEPLISSNVVRVRQFENGHWLLTRREITCMWALGSRNDPVFLDIFSGFKLHP